VRDNDTIILENLYVSILEEDATSSKAQALNFFVQNEVGREIFKYKNKPENKEVIDKAKAKWNPVVEGLEALILRHNPKDKHLSDIIPLSRFLSEADDINLLEKEYKDYVSHPTLLQQKTIQKAPNFTKWTEEIHSKNSENQDKKEAEVLGTSEDPNKVYEDDQVIVYLADNPNDPRKSIPNCKKYGKGTGLCISGPSAKSYYNSYRWGHRMTTYFVWLKKQNKYMLTDIDEKGQRQYNTVIPNDDYEATVSEIVDKYPETKKAFESGVFKSVPITGKELEFYTKYYKAKSIFDFTDTNSPEDFINYASFHDLTDYEWGVLMNSDVYPTQEILQTSIESAESDIPHNVLEKFPPLRKRYWAKKKQTVDRELAEWDEEDTVDFTDDEMHMIEIEKLPENFIAALEVDHKDAGLFTALVLDSLGRDLSEIPSRILMSSLMENGASNQIFAYLVKIKEPLSPEITQILMDDPLKTEDYAQAAADYHGFPEVYNKVPSEFFDNIAKDLKASFKWLKYLTHNDETVTSGPNQRFMKMVATDPIHVVEYVDKMVAYNGKFRRIGLKNLPDYFKKALFSSPDFWHVVNELIRLEGVGAEGIPEDFKDQIATSAEDSYYVSKKLVEHFDRIDKVPPQWLSGIATSAYYSFKFAYDLTEDDLEVPREIEDGICLSARYTNDYIDHLFDYGQYDKIHDRLLEALIPTVPSNDDTAPPVGSGRYAEEVMMRYARSKRKIPEIMIHMMKDYPDRVAKVIHYILQRQQLDVKYDIDPRLFDIVATQAGSAIQIALEMETYGIEVPDCLYKSIKKAPTYLNLYQRDSKKEDSPLKESLSFRSFFYRKIP
jgi:hypothetical protein